ERLARSEPGLELPLVPAEEARDDAPDVFRHGQGRQREHEDQGRCPGRGELKEYDELPNRVVHVGPRWPLAVGSCVEASTCVKIGEAGLARSSAGHVDPAASPLIVALDARALAARRGGAQPERSLHLFGALRPGRVGASRSRIWTSSDRSSRANRWRPTTRRG